VNAIPQATLPNIQDTGARGFLKWLQADQPGLYMKVLPVLRTTVPQLWSDAMQTRVMTNLGRMSYLGQDDDDDDDSGEDFESDIEANVGPTLETPSISPEDLTSLESSAENVNIDTASNANTGAVDPGTATSVGNVISSALSSVSNSSLAKTIASVVDGQLQNASAGLPPSSASTSGLGQAFSSLTSSSTALWLVGGGIALAVIALAMSG
jgi:hypothetical protein